MSLPASPQVPGIRKQVITHCQQAGCRLGLECNRPHSESGNRLTVPPSSHYETVGTIPIMPRGFPKSAP